MRRSIHTVLFLLGFVGPLTDFRAKADAGEPAPSAEKLRVAIVTGGHPFNEPEFFKLFQGHDDITYEHLPQKTGGEVFEDIDKWPYDVIVLFNFNQQITPKQQQNFVTLLDRGVGQVILHHANDAYLNWPLYSDISGVESHFTPWVLNGTRMPASDYSRGVVKFRIQVADSNHPITRGLRDYDFDDETYCHRMFSPENHILLTTDEPSSDQPLCWVRTFHDKARVFYIQSGHDERAYQNLNYRTIVTRAIQWTAGRLE